MQVPEHGIYAIFRDNKLIAALGYSLVPHDYVFMTKAPEEKIAKVEIFTEAIRSKKAPEAPRVISGPDRWELYGLPMTDNGPIDLVTATTWYWGLLQEDVPTN